MPRSRALPALLVALLALFLFWPAADALINPKYTPADLIRDSGLVLVLRASAPKDGRFTAEVVETLVGDAPAQKTLTFDFSQAEDLAEEKVANAFGGAQTALAVMCVARKKEGARVGAVEIGSTWMGLTESDDRKMWKADRDPKDLETVWGGSARKLVPAIRYTLSDPNASFPVAANMSWAGDLALGNLTGKAYGCLVTVDGVIVLSEGGDRVYRPGEKGQPPADVTAQLGLTSKSRALAAGDCNGDGRLDLASWDGAKLWLLLRGADGKFAAPSGGLDLPECRSLSTLNGGLAVGTGAGVTLLRPDGKGGLAAQQLAGPGGVCTVADFNNDGAPDIMQVSAEGLAFYAGQREPGAFAAPVLTKLQTVKVPVALVCGDYDGDGHLDLAVAGEGGFVLLGRENGQWKSITKETGELGEASGQGQGESSAVAACLSDLNGDGRQSVAFFQANAGPGLFFNRGFAAFGVARTLSFNETKLPAAEALGTGQTAGTLCDLNGDCVPDLLAVDKQQKVWAIFGETKESRQFNLTATTAGKEPLTVTASLNDRALGLWVVRPGEPAVICLPRAGKATLTWKTPDGTAQTRTIAVTGPKRVEL